MFYIWNLLDDFGFIDAHCIRQFDDYDEAFVFYLLLEDETNGSFLLLDEEENFEFVQSLQEG